MKLHHTLAALSLTLVAATAAAQSYPNRPVKVIVPFATGAASDIIARQVFDRVGSAMGQAFVVENRPGAGGTVGSEFVAKAPADGYTLLISTAALPISAGAYKNLRYDSGAFSSVTVMTHSPLAFASNLNFPPKTIKEFIDYAKANPGKVISARWASPHHTISPVKSSNSMPASTWSTCRTRAHRPPTPTSSAGRFKSCSTTSSRSCADQGRQGAGTRRVERKTPPAAARCAVDCRGRGTRF